MSRKKGKQKLEDLSTNISLDEYITIIYNFCKYKESTKEQILRNVIYRNDINSWNGFVWLCHNEHTKSIRNKNWRRNKWNILERNTKLLI